MSGDDGRHELDGTYEVRTVDDRAYETVGHTVVIDSTREAGERIVCDGHKGSFRYDDESWGSTVQGQLVDLASREKAPFEIAPVSGTRPRGIRCKVGDENTDPGSWTAEETGEG